MTPTETKYKSRLIARINSIKDKHVLDEVNRLLEVAIEETAFRVTPEQRQEVEEARSQLAKGEGISSDEADGEIEKWLLK